ncbi:MAG: uroporphyrinogen decarboxylase family protein [Eubacteriales bacterium]
MKNQMTVKERLLNSIKGKEIDRVAWSPFLAYYFQMLPKSEQAKGMFPYLQEMNADPLIRGAEAPFTVSNENNGYYETVSGNRRNFCYDTPVGKLHGAYTYSTSAQSWFLTDHPVKTEEDFKVLSYVASHTKICDNLLSSNAYFHEVGENGLCMPCLGAWSKTAFQALLEHWCGTVDLTYALYDFPEVVEETLSVMKEKNLETIEMALKSNHESFLFYEDTSTTNINPSMFETYIAPEISNWSKILHDNDKLLIHHACGHVKDLLPMMGATGVDMIESLSPPPTGNIEIADAFALLPSSTGIIGGIEPTFFANCTLEQLEARTKELLEISKGKSFILANSDSCPPEVRYEKFLFVSRLIGEGGNSF